MFTIVVVQTPVSIEHEAVPTNTNQKKKAGLASTVRWFVRPIWGSTPTPASAITINAVIIRMCKPVEPALRSALLDSVAHLRGGDSPSRIRTWVRGWLHAPFWALPEAPILDH